MHEDSPNQAESGLRIRKDSDDTFSAANLLVQAFQGVGAADVDVAVHGLVHVLDRVIKAFIQDSECFCLLRLVGESGEQVLFEITHILDGHCLKEAFQLKTKFF